MAEKKFDAGEIQIEDPLDFLSPAEKKEYIRAHQDTLLRSEEELQRIREATETAPVAEPDEETEASYEEEDLYEEEEDLYEEEEDDDDYGERPAGKPYVYRDTRLHTDERRQQAVKAKKAARPATGNAKSARPSRGRVAYAAEAGAPHADDEVEETAFDYMLSAAVKAFLAAILIIGLIMLYMIYVRPLIHRTTGLSSQAVSSQENEDTIGMGDTGDNTQGGAEQGEAPADGETVVTTTQLNLRTAPDTQTGEIVYPAPAGTRLTRLSDDGEWSKVLFNGQELYCASEFLKAE